MGNAEENSKSHLYDAMFVPKLLNHICEWNYPDRIAVEYHDLQRVISIRYAELHAAIQMISDYVACIKSFEFIGIDFHVSRCCVPSLMLGIVMGGHGFVNIPLEPVVRKKLVSSIRITYLFAQHVTEGEVIRKFTIHNESIYLIKLEHVREKNVQSVKKNRYAYAIATSGSTGIPKIVRVPHSSIVPNILDLKRILSVTRFDKIAQFTNFTFDPSILEILLAFSAAGTLFMTSESLKNDAKRLLQEAYSSQISILQTTPSLFLYSWSTETLKNTILSNNSSLRVLILGGEPLPTLGSLIEVKHPQNSIKIYNIYGITEVSCWASINEIMETDTRSDTRYLGKTLSETIFQVRGEKGEVITKGEGVLYIGSNTRICVLDNETVEELIRPVFRNSGDLVNIDEEGRIVYKGRKDSIIKRFGNKVDLTKLERAVLELSFVKNCYILWDESHHKLHLCLAATKKITECPDMKSDLKKHLQKLNPFYKPDKVHFLEYFEFTSSGKICTKFLRKYCVEDKAVDKKDLQKTEEAFRNIWMDHLKSESDGFVKLGGTSVMALQISSAVSEALNLEFPELIGMLLRDATFEECLSYIRSILLKNPGSKSITNLKDYDSIDKQTVSSVDAIMKEDVSFSNPLPVTNNKNVYQWHKCRGQIYGNVPINVESETISNIKILNTCDLQKCVDASPTVFRYLEGKSYATVGSHSGFICTIELEEKSVESYKVKLPDRIEASVLVLDDFKGIVGCYDGHVYCLHLKTGEVIWIYKTGDVVKCTAISCKLRERIFVGSYDCYAYCLSIEDGSEIWKTKASNGSITASGCLHPQSDSVLFGTLDGSCLALQQSSGKIRWKHKLGDPIFVAPVILSSGLVLFCTVAGILACFDIEVNVEMWKYTINGNVFSYIVTRNDPITKRESIILGSQNKNVYYLEAKDASFKTEPTLSYVFDFHSSIFATPWRESDVLFIACTDGTLNICSLSEKKLLKTVKLPGDVFSSPVVNDNLAIVGCRDNNVYILKLF